LSPHYRLPPITPDDPRSQGVRLYRVLRLYAALSPDPEPRELHG